MRLLRFGTDVGNLPYGYNALGPYPKKSITMEEANALIDKSLKDGKYKSRPEAEKALLEQMIQENTYIIGDPPAGYRPSWQPPKMRGSAPSFMPSPPVKPYGQIGDTGILPSAPSTSPSTSTPGPSRPSKQQDPSAALAPLMFITLFGFGLALAGRQALPKE